MFRPGDEDTHTDGLGSRPYIGGKTHTKIVINIQEHSSEAKDEGETQYTREVESKFNCHFCKLNCKFHTHIGSAFNMKVVEYVLCGYIFS